MATFALIVGLIAGLFWFDTIMVAVESEMQLPTTEWTPSEA